MSCSDNIEKALEYNEKIVLSYAKVADIEEKLMIYILSDDTAHIKIEYEKFVNQIDSSEKEIKVLGSFKDYPDFSVAALGMMSVYKKVALKEILDLMAYKKGMTYLEGSDSIKSEKALEGKLKGLDSLVESEFIKFETAQQKFAAKYSFKLMD